MSSLETILAVQASERVYKSNQLVEGSYKLTLQELRLLLLAISKVNPRRPLKKLEEFRITAKEFAAVYDLPVRTAYEALEDAAIRLYAQDIKTPSSNTHFRMVEKAQYQKGEGYIQLKFTETFAPYISMLYKEFTSFELHRVAKLSSAHTIRIFEMAQQFRRTGSFTITVEKVRHRLDLGASYARFNNLREKVIDPAIAEIKEKAGMIITYTTHSKGRKVEKLTFKVRETVVDPELQFETADQQCLDLSDDDEA